MKSTVRIGSRGSKLALYQAELVKTQITQNFPMVTVEIAVIKTSGDMIRKSTADPFETKRIYTKEIEDALLAGQIDLAVHSAKDMAAVLPEGLAIGAVLEREDSRDCLVDKDKLKLAELPMGARIGTSSLRRKMQILRLNPNVIVEDIHGNVDSRLRKIEEGNYDAIVLAAAGIKRLGLTNYIAEFFEPDRFFPSPGQGIIAIESRQNDAAMVEFLKELNHEPTARQLECERGFLRRLEGGCQLPCGIHTVIVGDELNATGIIFELSNPNWIEAEHSGALENAESVGVKLAEMILDKGGKEILQKMRQGDK